MDIELRKMLATEVDFFQEKMKEAFQAGVLNRFGELNAAPIPPEDELTHVIKRSTADVWVVLLNGKPVGSLVVEKEAGENQHALELFFIFIEFQNQKIGFKVWQLLESRYANVKRWEVHTPYFDRRNIHFYVNKCGFKIVEFLNESHRSEDGLVSQFKDVNASGFFRFEKMMY